MAELSPRAPKFPFLFGGAFIEADKLESNCPARPQFPFLFGGAFIEARMRSSTSKKIIISLPFRRGFH